MTILLPNIGITLPYKAMSLVRHASEQFVGTFLIPGGYGFADYTQPYSWLDYSSDPEEKDESSQTLLDMIRNKGVGAKGHDSEDGMYLQFWIGVLANPQSPCDVNFCVQHIRLLELQVLLQMQVEKDIPTHTEIMSFSDFQEDKRPDLPRDLYKWKTEDWKEFCHHNFAEHGNTMYERWLAKIERSVVS